MAFFDDFEQAVIHYPANGGVELTIVELAAVAPGVGPAVNANEIWQFKVRVRNPGPLNMTNVHLLVEGQNGANVNAVPGPPWVDGFLTGGLIVNGRMPPVNTPFYFFRAPGGRRQAGTTLVTARIHDFDANLNRILLGREAAAGPPSAGWAAEVFPA
jgi:hypothetical protein